MKQSRKTRRFVRQRLHKRVRRKVRGTPERPRLSVSFSHAHIQAQIIDDESSRTLVGISTLEKEVAALKLRPNVEGAARVGALLAQRAKSKKVESVVFDRGGFRYHGKVKALADAAREYGLQF